MRIDELKFGQNEINGTFIYSGGLSTKLTACICSGLNDNGQKLSFGQKMNEQPITTICLAKRTVGSVQHCRRKQKRWRSNGVAGIVAIYGLAGMRRHVDFSADGGCYHVCNRSVQLDHIGVPQVSDPVLLHEGTNRPIFAAGTRCV